MPLAFFRAVEDTVRETLQQGLHGWEVTDCTITMTHSGYLGKQSLGHQRFNKSMSSTGEDFRKLTPLVLMSALQQARHRGLRADPPLPARRAGRHARTASCRRWPGCARSRTPR